MWLPHNCIHFKHLCMLLNGFGTGRKLIPYIRISGYFVPESQVLLGSIFTIFKLCHCVSQYMKTWLFRRTLKEVGITSYSNRDTGARSLVIIQIETLQYVSINWLGQKSHEKYGWMMQHCWHPSHTAQQIGMDDVAWLASIYYSTVPVSCHFGKLLFVLV